MKRDLTWDEAFVLAGICVSAVMLRDGPHSQRFTPLLVLGSAVVLVSTRSTRVFAAVMAPAWLAARLWMTAPDSWPSGALHVFVAAGVWWLASGLRGAWSAGLLIAGSGWFPLWIYTARGHLQEAAGVAGLLGLYLLRTRWNASLAWQRMVAGALVVALIAWGGTMHVALLTLSLSAFVVIQAPLRDIPG